MDGHFNGSGSLYLASAQSLYVGEWKDGLRHGHVSIVAVFNINPSIVLVGNPLV